MLPRFSACLKTSKNEAKTRMASFRTKSHIKNRNSYKSRDFVRLLQRCSDHNVQRRRWTSDQCAQLTRGVEESAFRCARIRVGQDVDQEIRQPRVLQRDPVTNFVH